MNIIGKISEISKYLKNKKKSKIKKKWKSENWPKMANGPNFFSGELSLSNNKKISIAKFNSVQWLQRKTYDDAKFQKIKKMLKIPYLHFK